MDRVVGGEPIPDCKDLRSSGARLKLGYDPGGPPVLAKGQRLKLLSHLVRIGCVLGDEIARAVK